MIPIPEMRIGRNDPRAVRLHEAQAAGEVEPTPNAYLRGSGEGGVAPFVSIYRSVAISMLAPSMNAEIRPPGQ